jgi:hypothetical protein
MTTKEEAILQLKKENPVIKKGDDEQGYTELEAADYEATIEGWADNVLAKEAAELEAAKPLTAAEKLLAATGLTVAEYKALGL